VLVGLFDLFCRRRLYRICFASRPKKELQDIGDAAEHDSEQRQLKHVVHQYVENLIGVILGELRKNAKFENLFVEKEQHQHA
jgi:hypothetical protein